MNIIQIEIKKKWVDLISRRGWNKGLDPISYEEFWTSQ